LNDLEDILKQHEAISLEEMNEVNFFDREDIKYIFHIDKLLPLLENTTSQYKILTIDHKRLFRYKTLYYDTPGLKFYHDHHNGRRSRFKIRYREYVDSNQTYLEIKEKNNRERTIKKRFRIDHMQENFSQREIDFIHKFVPVEFNKLNPVLLTIFTRFTLVILNNRERITFDINPEFEGYSSKTELPFLVICEVKQDRMLPSSYFLTLLRSHKIFPSDLSKYSIGTVILNPAVKQNLFKTRLLTINKIKNDSGSYHNAT
jgi:hypothetical protein